MLSKPQSDGLQELLSTAKVMDVLYAWVDLGDRYELHAPSGTFRVRPEDAARFVTAMIRQRELNDILPNRAV